MQQLAFACNNMMNHILKHLLLLPVVFINTQVFCQMQDSTSHPSFKIKKKDSCYATVDGLTRGAINQDSLITAGGIKLQGCNNCNILSFEMLFRFDVVGKCAVPKFIPPFKSSSKKFTSQMMREIKNSQFSDCYTPTAVFYNISYVDSNGQVKKANTIILQLWQKNTTGIISNKIDQ